MVIEIRPYRESTRHDRCGKLSVAKPSSGFAGIMTIYGRQRSYSQTQFLAITLDKLNLNQSELSTFLSTEFFELLMTEY